ncbi:MAG: PilT/PilU family type 4a pilus ATPase [Planctomycetia bacterium]|nr:PilT/PilU family type 4a pilus ATPase [Candidatus Brocadia sp.]QOJ06012.1 MAG: PilT/PilU family type 4a pilus ATPase [Planctomycetia bacterium]TVL95465.1 MAG: type IV pili twitching motility protein PilT [Candidatus Brocadia sp. BL1]HQU31653.1 PilT/PilU family type 4a pilus ATPase [Candidatus Brocadia sapporoensis]
MEIQELLQEMVRLDASDIYITVNLPPIFRKEGANIPMDTNKLTSEDTRLLAEESMNEKQRKDFYERMEMNLALYYPELGRFRVNIFFQQRNIGLVIRQIKIKIQSVDDLCLPPIFKDIAMTKRGLVVVVGATGSGKSTTLAAMIDYRNANNLGHIITIEDPVEFVHQHKKSVITQREVGIDTLSFADALKNTLRQAPDVILVGEIRDTETMESSINFAETGHLCLATLHANNANQAIERIINFFPAERHEQIYLLLSLNLRSVISQRLVPAKDGKRVAAFEILLDTSRIKDLILNRQIDLLKKTMAQGTQEGMMTFDQSLFKLYKEGKISYENAIAYADSANDMRFRIKTENLGEEKEEKTVSFRLKQ